MRNSIPQLRSQLKGELFQGRLEDLGKAFYSLCQDGGQILPFFVLHEVCARLAAEMDRDSPVTPDDIAQLTADIGQQADDILEDVQRGAQVPVQKLESLVTILFRNLALHRN